MRAEELAAVRADIEDLNAGVLHVLSDVRHATWARRQWRMDEKSLDVVRRTTAEERRRIERCGAPLFKLRVPEAQYERHPAVPTAIGRLHLHALLTAMRVALLDELVATALFRAPAQSVARLSMWSVGTMQRVAYHSPDLVSIPRAGIPAFWQRLAEGGRVDGPVGEHLVNLLIWMGVD